MTNFLLSFAAGLALASLDIWGLVFLVKALGKNRATWMKAVLLLFVAGHLPLLALALWGLSKQDFFRAPALAAGLFIPFAAVAVFELRRRGKTGS